MHKDNKKTDIEATIEKVENISEIKLEDYLPFFLTDEQLPKKELEKLEALELPREIKSMFNELEQLEVTSNEIKSFIDTELSLSEAQNETLFEMSNAFLYSMIISKFLRDRYTRNFIKNLPTTDKAKSLELKKRFNGIQISDTELEAIKEKTPAYFEHDLLKEISSEFLLPFINKIDLNINYFELLFYTEAQSKFSECIPNYWDIYLKYFQFIKSKYPNLFYLKVDFEDKNTAQKRLIRYRQTLSKLS